MRRPAAVWLVLLAGALRLPGLWTDFWLDEIWALDNVGRIDSIAGVFSGIHHDSNHWLISIWMYLVGQQAPFWLYRLPSFLASLAAVVFAGRLAEAEGADRTLAMLLVAVSFALGFYASEARGYAIASAAAFGALLYVLRWLDDGRRRWLWLAWTWTVLGLLGHLSFVAVLAALFVFLVGRAATRSLPIGRALLPLVAPVGVLVFLAVVDLRYLRLGGGPPLDLASLGASLGLLAFGMPLDVPASGWLGLAGGLIVLALVGARSFASATGREPVLGVFYAVLLLLPPLVAAVLQPPFLFPRYFLVSLGFVPLLLAMVLPRLGTVLRGLVVVAILAAQAASWAGFWRDGRGRYGEAVAAMLAAVPDGPVLVDSDHEFRTKLMLTFYARRLDPEGRLQCGTDGARFTILSNPSTVASPAACGACRPFREDASSPLSGLPWRIYWRSP